MTSRDKKYMINGEVYNSTRIDLKQTKKINESREYEDLFKELDKIRDNLKTGTDIVNAISERINLPRSECTLLMTSYLLRKRKKEAKTK